MAHRDSAATEPRAVTAKNATYYARRAAGLCPECGQPSGIWTFCARCRAFHRHRVKAASPSPRQETPK